MNESLTSVYNVIIYSQMFIYFAYSWQTLQIILDEPVSICLRYFCFSCLMWEIFHICVTTWSSSENEIRHSRWTDTISSDVNDATDVFLSRCFMSSSLKTHITYNWESLSIIQSTVRPKTCNALHAHIFMHSALLILSPDYDFTKDLFKWEQVSPWQQMFSQYFSVLNKLTSLCAQL